MPLNSNIILSAIWDVVTAVISAVVTMVVLYLAFTLVLLSEMAGPRSVTPPILFISALAVAPTTYLSEFKTGVIGGIISGLVFSLPLLFFLRWLAHIDPIVLREHGEQLRFCGIAVVSLATLVMGCVAHGKSKPPDSHVEPQTEP